MNDTLRKRTNDLLYGSKVSSFADRFVPMAPVETEQEYGVDHDNKGNVILSLGDAPSFKVPRDTGIKLAMLILKHCGVTVEASKDGK